MEQANASKYIMALLSVFVVLFMLSIAYMRISNMYNNPMLQPIKPTPLQQYSDSTNELRDYHAKKLLDDMKNR